jgi:hypothetical protein
MRTYCTAVRRNEVILIVHDGVQKKTECRRMVPGTAIVRSPFSNEADR